MIFFDELISELAGRKSRDVRPLTRDFYYALVLDVWPSPAAVMDFGISSEDHYGALKYAVCNEDLSPEKLDDALGCGKRLQALISPSNPYRFVKFETSWDGLQIEDEDPEGVNVDTQEG